jgi:hypothetical protein
LTPPRDDHVLLAIHDVQIALVVEMTDVSLTEPPVDDPLRGEFLVVRVAQEHRW